MSKYEDNYRVLIKDNYGELFRIFNIAFAKDIRDEEYIKFQFPYLGKLTLFKGNLEQGKKSYLTEIENLSPFIPAIEYSYHYVKGVAQWKTKDRRYAPKHLPQLESVNAVTIFRFTFSNLSFFEKYKKKLTDRHCILTNPFIDLPRRYEIRILHKGNYNFSFENSDPENWIPTDFLSLERHNLVIVMQGYQLNEKVSGSILEIFQLDHPESNIERKYA